MPAGPVMRPGAEAWHGGPSTWALGLCDIGGGGGWVQGLPPTRTLTQHGGERKILIQLCSGCDGFWLGSTPRLASDAAQDGQGGPESERDADRQPPACPKTSREFAAPLGFLFTLRYDEWCKAICRSFPCMSGAGGRVAASTFVTWPDRITQHKRVSGGRLWLGFPKGWGAP